MRKTIYAMLLASIAVSCNPDTTQDKPSLAGTWKLLTGTLVENGKSTTTDYTKGRSMIKVINDTHFTFLNHDLGKGEDSTSAFVAGGGRYTLSGNQYTEDLEYCSDRQWEGHSFRFTVEIKGDTLIQSGVEKLEDAGIERHNTEVYIKIR